MENPSNIVPDQLIVLEGDAGLVPKASSGDVGKVLGVLNSSGDVGWVPDQEGMAQVQSDWDQTDSSQVSYIANKPNLSVYATTSAMDTALAGKQDTISDLADIRSGAAKGDTAVQPAALDDYATTSAMNTALAGKQDTISDLDTIRSGASLGATAVQPSDLPSSDELVPSATSVDAGKVLTVGNDGTASWITPSAGTVYTPGDGVDIANNVISADVDGVTIGIDSTTKQIKSLQTIPTKTSDLQNDSNFVVASSLATVATTGSYSDLSNKPSIPAAQVNSDWNAVSGVSQILNKPNLATVATTGAYSDLSGTPTIPTVDQTYNASSTNAQSGVAVAQAIASIPSASYTAGDGIAIESDEISVDYDSNTLDTVAATITESVSYVDQYDGFTLPSAIQQMQTQSDTVNVTVHIPANTFKWPYRKDDYIFTFALLNGLVTRITNSYVDAPLSYTEVSSTEYWINEQDIVITLPTLQTNGWEFDTNLSTKVSFNIVAKTPGQNDHNLLTTISNDGTLASPVTFTYQGGSHEMLTIKNPLPASTSADENKVLKVNASGNAEWGTDGFTTTAGITDIQQVSALPANPVATVLYLIPEA